MRLVQSPQAGAVLTLCLTAVAASAATPDWAFASDLPGDAVDPQAMDAMHDYVGSLPGLGGGDGNDTFTLGTLTRTNDHALLQQQQQQQEEAAAADAAAAALPAVSDPLVCAAAGTTGYVRPPLAPVAATCPVPLGRDGRRRHRRAPHTHQTWAGLHLADATHDPSHPASWQPWTHRPVCGVATSYCLYTSASLPVPGQDAAAAQGISILTTPEMAAHSLHPHQFALDAAAAGRAHDAYYPQATPTVVRRHPTPGKGEGVFALRALRAGEPVVVDRPALLAHFHVPTAAQAAQFGTTEDDHGLGAEADDDRASLWSLAVAQLPENVAEQIMDLHVSPRYRRGLAPVAPDSTPDGDRPPPPQLSHAEKVFASNSFAIDVDGYPFKALFPALAKLNHDCRPNLMAEFAEIPLTMTVWATRDIQAGEELTLDYLGEPLPSAQRADRIQRRWGFRCLCAQCAGADDEDRTASDARRARIPGLLHDVQAHQEAGDDAQALTAARALHGLLVADGLMRPTAATADMLLLPGQSAESAAAAAAAAAVVQSKPMADPFGPAGLAEMLATLNVRTGHASEALPYIRASMAALGRQTLAWPDEDKKQRMQKLAWLEDFFENHPTWAQKS